MASKNVTAQKKETPVFLGDEVSDSGERQEFFKLEPKTDLNPYDIFKLAKGILIVAAIMYVLFALIRIFYNDSCSDNAGIKEVWEYSKVILNSIVSLVLGLYFGSKQEAKNKG